MNIEELYTRPIGTKEAKKIEAKRCVIKEAEIKEMGEKKNPILMLAVKHPDKDDLIKISKVKLIEGTSVKLIGLWVNQDEDGNIQKGSALAKFMSFYSVTILTQLKDLEVDTELDDKGYLCVKAY